MHIKQNYSELQRLIGKIYFKVHPQLRRNRAAFEKLRIDYYTKFWHQAAEAIHADIEHLGDNFLRVSKNGRWTVVNNGNVMLDDHVTLDMAGNKVLIQSLLSKLDFPVPQSHIYKLDTIDTAIEFQKQLGRKVVVKPKHSSTGRGVTVNIETEEELVTASVEAASIDANLILEEHIEGASFRLLYLRGQFIDAVRRDPPMITGDGKNSIKVLISHENKKRINQQKVEALSPFTIDAECINTLKKKGLSLKSVPKLGDKIQVMTVVNLNSRFENHIVRDEVHPETIKMGAKVCAHFGVDLAGIDLMARDISQPLSGGNGVINEINTTPGLHHHDLVAEEDQRIRVGELILEDLLANSTLTL